MIFCVALPAISDGNFHCTQQHHMVDVQHDINDGGEENLQGWGLGEKQKTVF